MKFLEEYIVYLKDNPKGYWFKRKLYGLGWVPAKTQGWIVLFGFILAVGGVIFHTEQSGYAEQYPDRVTIAVFVLSALFLSICWKTGESLRWRRGDEKDEV